MFGKKNTFFTTRLLGDQLSMFLTNSGVGIDAQFSEPYFLVLKMKSVISAAAGFQGDYITLYVKVGVTAYLDKLERH